MYGLRVDGIVSMPVSKFEDTVELWSYTVRIELLDQRGGRCAFY
jgi:hypothetical protein